MTTQLLLAALVACSTGQATCDSYSVEDVTYVNICGVVPIEQKEELGKQPSKSSGVKIDGNLYILTMDAFCEST
jgi:hypothetical protein